MGIGWEIDVYHVIVVVFAAKFVLSPYCVRYISCRAED